MTEAWDSTAERGSCVNTRANVRRPAVLSGQRKERKEGRWETRMVPRPAWLISMECSLKDILRLLVPANPGRCLGNRGELVSAGGSTNRSAVTTPQKTSVYNPRGEQVQLWRIWNFSGSVFLQSLAGSLYFFFFPPSSCRCFLVKMVPSR